MRYWYQVLATGCMQIPGFHWIGSSPDPVVGQWVGGEPPQTDFHMIFFENQTYLLFHVLP